MVEHRIEASRELVRFQFEAINASFNLIACATNPGSWHFTIICRDSICGDRGAL